MKVLLPISIVICFKRIFDDFVRLIKHCLDRTPFSQITPGLLSVNNSWAVLYLLIIKAHPSHMYDRSATSIIFCIFVINVNAYGFL